MPSEKLTNLSRHMKEFFCSFDSHTKIQFVNISSFKLTEYELQIMKFGLKFSIKTKVLFSQNLNFRHKSKPMK